MHGVDAAWAWGPEWGTAKSRTWWYPEQKSREDSWILNEVDAKVVNIVYRQKYSCDPLFVLVSWVSWYLGLFCKNWMTYRVIVYILIGQKHSISPEDCKVYQFPLGVGGRSASASPALAFGHGAVVVAGRSTFAASVLDWQVLLHHCCWWKKSCTTWDA